MNQWESHEDDETVKALDEEIEQNRRKKLKVWTPIKENNRKMEERDRGMEELITMVAERGSDKTQSEERGSSSKAPRASNTQSSCFDHADDGEELDYLFLVKIKKRERNLYVQFLLNEDKTVWEGPFDLDSHVHHLIRHNNTVHCPP